MRDLNTSAHQTNDDLKKIELQIHQWKTSFNSNPSKKVQEVIFSWKRKKHHHPDIILTAIQLYKTLTKTSGIFSG